jgi:hypothetical protein
MLRARKGAGPVEIIPQAAHFATTAVRPQRRSAASATFRFAMIASVRSHRLLLAGRDTTTAAAAHGVVAAVGAGNPALFFFSARLRILNRYFARRPSSVFCPFTQNLSTIAPWAGEFHWHRVLH